MKSKGILRSITMVLILAGATLGLVSCSSGVPKAEFDSLSQELEAATANEHQLEKDIILADSRIQTLERDLNEADARIETLEREKAEAVSRIATLDLEKSETDNRIEALEQILDEAEDWKIQHSGLVETDYPDLVSRADDARTILYVFNQFTKIGSGIESPYQDRPDELFDMLSDLDNDVIQEGLDALFFEEISAEEVVLSWLSEAESLLAEKVCYSNNSLLGCTM